jgi:hypothetical protein
LNFRVLGLLIPQSTARGTIEAQATCQFGRVGA